MSAEQDQTLENLRTAAGGYLARVTGLELYREASAKVLTAELRRLQPPPPPAWFAKVRDLLGDVVLAAGFTETDLAGLPPHVERLRNTLVDYQVQDAVSQLDEAKKEAV